MAETEIHKSKRKKNLVVLALVLGWCVLIFVISLVRMARADDAVGLSVAPDAGLAAAETDMSGLIVPDLPHGAFYEDRKVHRERMDETPVRWRAEREAGQAVRDERDAARDADRAAHRGRIAAAGDERFQIWRDGEGARQDAAAARDQARAAHRDGLQGRPASWWRERLNP